MPITFIFRVVMGICKGMRAKMFPEKFREKMERLLGEEIKEFEAAFDTQEERHHALRLNTSKVNDKELIIKTLCLGNEQASTDNLTQNVPWEGKGYYYQGDMTPGKHPYHEAGLYYIQEPSAMAPVHFLDPKPGDKVLDLCAAPGGKSTQIADAMRGEGLLVTNEINRDRAKILSLNIERMGITNAMVLNEDSGHLSEIFEGFFDKILVDAPCSGEGMFRKNEIALSEWSEDNVRLCADRQLEILGNAAKMLLPGGRLVYSTCTFSPEENEETIFKFLAGHEDFHVEKVRLCGGMENARKDWVDVDKCCDQPGDLRIESKEADRLLEEVGRAVRLWPGKVRGEGHFLCVLHRDGELLHDSAGSFVPGGRPAHAKKEAAGAFISFAKENLKVYTDVDPCNILSFGDQIYLAPPGMPSPDGLKVLRPGLHLGTVKKDRFEPSHALALSLGRDEAVLTADFASDSDEIRQFLNGQTLRPGGEMAQELLGKKGWCLITCDGYSIGWAKLAGGMLKNHYPKGLRINY